MCHVCNKIYSTQSTLSRHLKKRHNYQWFSGHSRFRYKLEADGYYRLQMLRYESLELVEEQLNKANSNSSTTITVPSTSRLVESSTTTTMEDETASPTATTAASATAAVAHLEIYSNDLTSSCTETSAEEKTPSKRIAEIEQVLVLAKNKSDDNSSSLTTLETATTTTMTINDHQFGSSDFHAEFNSNLTSLHYCNLNTINIGNQSNLNYHLLDQSSLSSSTAASSSSIAFNAQQQLKEEPLVVNNVLAERIIVVIGNNDNDNQPQQQTNNTLELINNLTINDLTNNCETHH